VQLRATLAATTNMIHAQHILLAVDTPTPGPVNDSGVDVWETEGGQIVPVPSPASRSEAPMSTTAGPGVAEHAIALFGQWSGGHWDEVRRDFDLTMTESLSAAAIADVWRQVASVVGAYERTGEPFVHQQADYTMVDLPLEFEAGAMKGRVAYNSEGRVAGLFILVPDVS